MSLRTGARLAVLASGRGTNFVALADAARQEKLGSKIAVLVSDREQAPVLEIAKERKIPTQYLDPGGYRTRLSKEAEAEYVRVLQERGVDTVVLAGFMRILRSCFLEAFPNAVLNIHPSLLPAFPGLDAVRQALEHGVSVTGCTVHLVNESVDAGPILAQAPVPVFPDDDPDQLLERIHVAEHRLYPETVRRFLTEPFRLKDRRVIWGKS